MARYTNPRDVYHGAGSLAELKNLKGKKAVICVGGGSMKRGGFLQRAEDYLHEAGFETKIIEGIESDPSVDTVMNGAQVMLDFEPDWIVAIGGGSTIDAAKGMWIKYEYPDMKFEDMLAPNKLPELRKKARLCAVTSTSGTGTEVTSFSIVTDYEKGIKYPIADFEITPDVAIVDSDLVAGLPKKLVAHTGMDALTHCIEAWVSTAESSYTNAMAIYGAKMIKANIVNSYNGDLEARAAMHDAQCLAGMAFSSASLGIVHSLAHKTGAAYIDQGAHIIHGAANAMYLPKVIAFNANDQRALERYAMIADEFKLGGTSDKAKVGALIEFVRQLNDDLNIPHGIKFYGADALPAEQGFLPEDVFQARKADVARNAIGDACTLTNPIKPTQEQMEEVLSACYYDTEIAY
jgi:alcohol dehydrogenase class IV